MKHVRKDSVTVAILMIGIVTTFTIFLPAMSFASGDSSFTGLQVVLGTEFANFGSWASGNIHFSFLGLMAYLLPLAAVASIVFLKKGSQLAILLFVASAILLFLLPTFTKTTVSVLGSTTEIDVDWVVLFGLYLAQGLVVIGVLGSAYQIIFATNQK